MVIITILMICFFQDFLKYSSKAGLDCHEIEVRDVTVLNCVCVCVLLLLSKCCISFNNNKFCLLFSPLLFFLQKAVDLMFLVPKRCNDMMNLGRLQGYEVGFHLPLCFTYRLIVACCLHHTSPHTPHWGGRFRTEQSW